MTRIAAAMLLPALVAIGCGAEPSVVDHLERARDYRAEGQLQSAAIETRNALKSDPENAEARLLLGEIRLRTGDAVSAEKELRKARELGIDDASTLPALARALLRQDKLDELLALDTSALPPSAEASVLASQALARFVAGDDAAATVAAERGLGLDPDAVEARLVLARLDAAGGNLGGATKRVRGALDGAPGHAESWEFLGDLERAAGRAEAAIAAYGQAVEHADRPLSARLKRAEVEVGLDGREAALADLDVLSRAGVELPGIDNARGRLALRDGDLADAQTYFERSLKLGPDFAPALANLALTHLAMGNAEQAELYGKRLLVNTDEADHARRLLAAVRLENGRYALAEDTIEPVVRANRTDALAARLMGTTLLKQGKFDEAIEQMVATSGLLPADRPEGSAASLVFTRAPSHELLDERGPGADVPDGEAGAGTDDGFLDEEQRQIARVPELLGRGENERALEVANALRAMTPDNPVPHNLLGQVHLASARREAARAAFEQSLALDGRNASANRYLAELDLSDGDVDAARTRLETLLEQHGNEEGVLLQLARVEARAGDDGAVLDWLERARDTNSGSILPVLTLARYRSSRAEHERALDELAALDERQRGQAEALRIASVSQLALGRFEEALASLDALIVRQPGVAPWHHLRAQAHAGLEDTEAAVRDLREAVEIAPDFAPSQLAMANADIIRGDLKAANERVERLRDLIPGTADLDRIVARLEASVAAGESGAVAGGAAASLADPTGAGTRRRLESTEAALAAARELWTSGERTRSAKLLETWLEANPQDVTTRFALANAYGELERFDAAVAEYERLLEEGTNTLSERARLIALNNLAWHLRERDPPRAAGYAEQALEVTPDSAATLDTLAVIRLGQGDARAAKRAFDRALETGTDDPTILYHGAQIEAELGNGEAARALLAPLVERGVDFPDAKNAARLLDEIGR